LRERGKRSDFIKRYEDTSLMRGKTNQKRFAGWNSPITQRKEKKVRGGMKKNLLGGQLTEEEIPSKGTWRRR